MVRLEFKKLRKILFFVFGIAVIFSLGYFLGFKGYQIQFLKSRRVTISRNLPIDKTKLDFNLFWDVWDTLESKYYDQGKLDSRKMVYGAIEGMVAAVGDPYTVFLPPSENKIANEDLSGSFEGVGIQIGFKGTQLSVMAPLPGSPAEKVGVKAGDAIVGIKDTEAGVDMLTSGISLTEAVKVIRGKEGTKVTLYITRDGKTEVTPYEITRAKVDVPSVILSYADKGEKVARIQLLKFGEETGKEWNEAVGKIAAKPDLKGVILDLRNNPGGYLEMAVDLAGEFVKTGSVVTIEERASGDRKEYKTARAGKLLNTPLVVLINGGSASASEILAGALKDYNRAKLVGEKSFGKGSIQEPLDFDAGSGLHITVAKWLTPKGFWVNGTGLEPDVKIVLDEKVKEDNQIQEALRLIQ